MDPITKMNISFVAIGLMFACNFLLLFARKTASSPLRFFLKTVSFLMLIVTFVLILIVLFV
jgi:hypothetical protein